MDKKIMQFVFILYLGYLIAVNGIGGRVVASVIEIAGLLAGISLIFTFIKEKIKGKDKKII